MKLARLAPHLRAAGLEVFEVPGWSTRGVGGQDLVATRGVLWHHTATRQAGADMPSLSVLVNGRSDLRGPLAQIGLGRSGRVYLLAAGRANHAGPGDWPGLTGNSDLVGVEMESVGDGSDWTAAQLRVMPVLGAALSRALGIPASLHIAHREWAPDRKVDPRGIDMARLRRDIAAHLTPTTNGDGLMPWRVIRDGSHQYTWDGYHDPVWIRSGMVLSKVHAATSGSSVPILRFTSEEFDQWLRELQASRNDRPQQRTAEAGAVWSHPDAPTLDTSSIVEAVAAGLNPSAIADAVVAALPTEQAGAVVDELARRIQEG